MNENPQAICTSNRPNVNPECSPTIDLCDFLNGRWPASWMFEPSKAPASQWIIRATSAFTLQERELVCFKGSFGGNKPRRLPANSVTLPLQREWAHEPAWSTNQVRALAQASTLMARKAHRRIRLGVLCHFYDASLRLKRHKLA